MAESLSTGMVNAINTVGCVKDIFQNFVICVFDGTKPANADATEGTANILGWVTVDGGAFTPGVATNGLNFGTSTDGYLYKAAAETWKMTGLAAAGTGTTATWFRAYANDVTTGASTTAVRFDGSIGNSSSFELQMSNPVIVENGPTTVPDFYYRTKKS